MKRSRSGDTVAAMTANKRQFTPEHHMVSMLQSQVQQCQAMMEDERRRASSEIEYARREARENARVAFEGHLAKLQEDNHGLRERLAFLKRGLDVLKRQINSIPGTLIQHPPDAWQRLAREFNAMAENYNNMQQHFE